MDYTILDKYYYSKMNFIAGICNKLGVTSTMNHYLTSSNGRKPDISYGTLAEMMIVNLCDSYKPLYIMNEYFEEKDLATIFNSDISLEQINDDRFGAFLDKLHAVGPRKIFSQISAQAFATYGLTVKNVNFDTTSKVMWGEYETEEGKVGAVNITFGHSKDKREDKKQIKMAIGTANGVIVDAKVLSGNIDDKTYNYDNLNDIDELLQRTHTDKSSFYYIGDSAVFTENNLIRAREKGIKIITRVPDKTLIAKQLICEALDKKQLTNEVSIENAHKELVHYKVSEYIGDYKGIDCKFAVCYSHSLEGTKNRSILKQVSKEAEDLL
ncbi:transposase [Clostridium punense]|uniref:Transposase n=4 Tax=Clostridium TaxID=1485 RepID=A0ABS4K220_9CLOT|nr:IS1634 family transposase [Clostridium punense]MBP2021824.1 transposase [Clostridium punense]